ncbi:sulfotransferase [Caulobacter sp. S45]|uniref:tetratricopeptide repeat-containing sulfotransferase family protein n=1 Tax=Caulobacter sp. S45 TaxID=1641861 RepID=UPI001575163C|nr:sulfotransferase [Caulobacter sp. S45]
MPSDTTERPSSVLGIQAAAARGDMENAFAMIDGALAAGEMDPLLYKLRAVRSERRGEFAAAVEDFEQALALTPWDPAVLNALGLCEARLGRRPRALQHLGEALRLQPDFAAAYVNRAWVLEGLGELEAACADYQQAVSFDEHQPFAWAALAMLAARQGDWQAARSGAARAHADGKDVPTAIIALALADAGEDRPAEGCARLEALLLTPHLQQDERALAQGVLADLLDRLGDTAAAFRLYVSCNADLEAANPEAVAHWRVRGARSVVARLLDTPAEDFRSDGAGSRTPDPRAPETHVFLIGFPRSGTTLLGQVLAGHPEVSTLDERETLADAAQVFLQDGGGLQRLHDLDPDTADTFRRLYWDRVTAGGVMPGRKVFVDKLPMNILGLPIIHRLFPQALILHSVRDPRDVVLSCFRQRFALGPSTVEFLELHSTVGFYADVVSFCLRALETSPLGCLQQQHEALVLDFEGETRRLCHFMGVDWTPIMQGFASQAQARFVATPSSADISGGLSDRSIGRWRRYQAELGSVLPRLDPWVRRFGYP